MSTASNNHRRAPMKPRGAGTNQTSELTRLKGLPARDRAAIFSWRHETPPLTNAEMRGRLQARFGITLRRDGQLSEFWSFQFCQQQQDFQSKVNEALDELVSTVDWEVRRLKARLFGEAK